MGIGIGGIMPAPAPGWPSPIPGIMLGGIGMPIRTPLLPDYDALPHGRVPEASFDEASGGLSYGLGCPASNGPSLLVVTPVKILFLVADLHTSSRDVVSQIKAAAARIVRTRIRLHKMRPRSYKAPIRKTAPVALLGQKLCRQAATVDLTTPTKRHRLTPYQALSVLPS
jgi:hypothetical protein